MNLDTLIPFPGYFLGFSSSSQKIVSKSVSTMSSSNCTGIDGVLYFVNRDFQLGSKVNSDDRARAFTQIKNYVYSPGSTS